MVESNRQRRVESLRLELEERVRQRQQRLQVVEQQQVRDEELARQRSAAVRLEVELARQGSDAARLKLESMIEAGKLKAAQQQEREDELDRLNREAVRVEAEASEKQELQQASQLAERVAPEESAAKTKEAPQQIVREGELARQGSKAVRLEEAQTEQGKARNDGALSMMGLLSGILVRICLVINVLFVLLVFMF